MLKDRLRPMLLVGALYVVLMFLGVLPEPTRMGEMFWGWLQNSILVAFLPLLIPYAICLWLTRVLSLEAEREAARRKLSDPSLRKTPTPSVPPEPQPTPSREGVGGRARPPAEEPPQSESFGVYLMNNPSGDNDPFFLNNPSGDNDPFF